MGAVVVVSVSSEGDLTLSKRIVIGTLHLSTSYASGGDTFTVGQFGLEKIDFMSLNLGLNSGDVTKAILLTPILPATATGSAAAGTIQAFWSAASATFLAEASGDLHAYVANYWIEGW